MGNREKQLEDYIEKTMFYQDIPGVAMVITDKNKIIYSKGFGITDILSKKPVTEKTIFHMASITKLFVATAIMQLVEKEKIDLHKPVTHYLTHFSIEDKRYKKITVLQMLSHTSGIPDCEDYGWDRPEYDDEALKRYITGLKDIHLISDPGKEFHYSNIAYEILGYLIEVVSDMTFEDYIKKHIIEPLEMEDSTLLSRSQSDEMAKPHSKNQDKKVVLSQVFPYNRRHAPSSTLTSNLVDMSKWAIVNLNRGVFQGKKILGESSYRLMWSPTMNIKGEEQKIGLGWFLSKQGQYDIKGHEGSDIGFRTSFGVIPEQSLGIGVFANMDNVSTRRIMRAAFDIILGVE
ncbi:serine hydrolase domain-containing protein [Natronincola ferrireducens]|uniref:CubicO group peptidase, beta-lactamase class C family n=1 Tax=Natronincola ferrireducens TaxID=393762 RepID=A0A1G9EJ65_9FIRM|nr:serine hydrolase domain-containing protein [Natronincola ferrireducens]SDK76123.1 CubicO group peptidase, beta-lactamase class C family [Natronincola ferrireducens]